MEVSVDFLKIALYVIAAYLVLGGVLTIGVGLFATEMLNRPTVRLLTIGRRLPPTRSNAVLMGAWGAMIGTYFVLSISQLFVASLVAFVLWIPLTYLVIKRIFFGQQKA